MPRPTKLTRKMLDEIVSALQQHLSLGGAARRVHVPKSTLVSWLRRGRDGSGSRLMQELARRVDEVLADLEAYHVARIAAATKQWQASAWLLERRFVDDWGRHNRLSNDDEQSVEIVDE